MGARAVGSRLHLLARQRHVAVGTRHRSLVSPSAVSSCHRRPTRGLHARTLSRTGTQSRGHCRSTGEFSQPRALDAQSPGSRTLQEGRIFLAGDAAYRFPPTGGFGANTGLQDVHNLAWKLVAVLQGWAAPSLLETYEEERRPIAQANTEFSVTNGRRWEAARKAIIGGDDTAIATALREQVKHLGSEGQDLGFWYANGAVVPDGSPAPRADSQIYVPTARPGSRAPHMWFRRDEPDVRAGPRLISLIDLFERKFVLLTNTVDEGWRAAGRQASSGRVGRAVCQLFPSDQVGISSRNKATGWNCMALKEMGRYSYAPMAILPGAPALAG
jgi:FAD binding domain